MEERRMDFQFFPSCCCACVERAPPARAVTFNSFPVAATGRRMVQRSTRTAPSRSFQFFPSCCELYQRALGAVRFEHCDVYCLSILSQLLHRQQSDAHSRGCKEGCLSILSQLLPAQDGEGEPRKRLKAFNSFPVAARRTRRIWPSSGPTCLSILSQLLPTTRSRPGSRPAGSLSILSQLLQQ